MNEAMHADRFRLKPQCMSRWVMRRSIAVMLTLLAGLAWAEPDDACLLRVLQTAHGDTTVAELRASCHQPNAEDVAAVVIVDYNARVERFGVGILLSDLL
jgi:hypothetical protein